MMKIYFFNDDSDKLIEHQDRMKFEDGQWNRLIIDKEGAELSKRDMDKIIDLCGIKKIKKKEILVYTSESFVREKYNQKSPVALKLDYKLLYYKDRNFHEDLVVDIRKVDIIKKFKYKNQIVRLEDE